MSDLVQTKVLGRPTALEFERCALVVISGPDEGKRFDLEASRATAGTSANCDFVLTDEAVSGAHFAIEASAEGWRVRDLESTNGTSINDVLVREAYAEPGDVLMVGESQLRLEGSDENVTIPLSRNDAFGEVLGRGLRMRELFYVLEQVAPQDVTVLLIGETGTGKELVARSLHEASPRAGKPFVCVDCGALPDNLIESELFGHTKGAFTGATADRAGAFEAADGGTVFLDEVGELPPAQQSRLLRVLEERSVRRLGENTERQLDIRVIAATNRRLAEEAEEGEFRKDLYFRLSVMEVHLPPLRERVEDIELLAEHLLEELNESTGRSLALGRSTLRTLQAHPWPGNVRELRNVLTRAHTLTPEDSDEIDVEAVVLGSMQRGTPLHADASVPWADAQKDFERAYLVNLMDRHEGNVARAAETMGIHRQSLYRMLKRHGLKPK